MQHCHFCFQTDEKRLKQQKNLALEISILTRELDAIVLACFSSSSLFLVCFFFYFIRETAKVKKNCKRFSHKHEDDDDDCCCCFCCCVLFKLVTKITHKPNSTTTHILARMMMMGLEGTTLDY